MISGYHRLAKTDEASPGRSRAGEGPPPHLRALDDVLRWRAADTAGLFAFAFLGDGENETGRLTYRELDRRARALAGQLQRYDCRGQRVLILLEPGLDFIAGLFACFYAGAIGVPVVPPDPVRLHRTLPRLKAIAGDADAGFVFADDTFAKCLDADLRRSLRAAPLVLEEALTADPHRWQPPQVGEHDPALLQYTSGSTGTPRGIVLSHSNMMHSLAAMFREDVPDAVGVTWLPPYHDFGLIGGVLLPVFAGREAVVMSPLAFVERPVRWLHALHRYRGTTSGSPNFGYELCVRKIAPEDCRHIDLSSWKIAVVGAEPVRADVLDRFAEKFAPCGFRRETFLPAYGLAEAVLNVTSGRWFDPPVVRAFSRRGLAENRAEPVPECDPAAWRLVGCGQPWSGQRVAIVDAQTNHEAAPGQVGEIWVQSPNVGLGYWNKPDETRAVFQAQLNGDGEFLRTGDLGFFDQGELFVVGRTKELVILNGRNYYPHDIERVVARSHPALRPDSGAAFACELDGAERLIVVQEARRTARISTAEVIAAIRRELAAEYLLAPHAIVLIAGGSVPRTNSGKIRRRACRDMFLAGELDVVAEWRSSLSVADAPRHAGFVAPRSPLEEEIARVWAEVLRVEAVGIHDNFFELGGNSLLAAELYTRLRYLLPADLSLARLFECPTVAALAALIYSEQVAEQPSPEIAALLTELEGMSETEAAARTNVDCPNVE